MRYISFYVTAKIVSGLNSRLQQSHVTTSSPLCGVSDALRPTAQMKGSIQFAVNQLEAYDVLVRPTNKRLRTS